MLRNPWLVESVDVDHELGGTEDTEVPLGHAGPTIHGYLTVRRVGAPTLTLFKGRLHITPILDAGTKISTETFKMVTSL